MNSNFIVRRALYTALMFLATFLVVTFGKWLILKHQMSEISPIVFWISIIVLAGVLFKTINFLWVKRTGRDNI